MRRITHVSEKRLLHQYYSQALSTSFYLGCGCQVKILRDSFPRSKHCVEQLASLHISSNSIQLGRAPPIHCFRVGAIESRKCTRRDYYCFHGCLQSATTKLHGHTCMRYWRKGSKQSAIRCHFAQRDIGPSYLRCPLSDVAVSLPLKPGRSAVRLNMITMWTLTLVCHKMSCCCISDTIVQQYCACAQDNKEQRKNMSVHCSVRSHFQFHSNMCHSRRNTQRGHHELVKW